MTRRPHDRTLHGRTWTWDMTQRYAPRMPPDGVVQYIIEEIERDVVN